MRRAGDTNSRDGADQEDFGRAAHRCGKVAVFSWAKKNPSEGERNAYQMGQDLAARLGKAFDAYKGKRFDPILEQYLIIFREQLQQAIKSEHMPPYYSAKAQAESFGAELAKLKHQMYAEMSVAVADWLQEYPADVKGDCERVTHAWIDRLCENSANDAIKIIDDYKPVLEDADALWRKSHPDLVERFPKL